MSAPFTLLIIESYDDSLRVAKCNNAIVVCSLKEACNLIINKKIDIDCVVADMNLKDSDGLSTILRIRNVYEGVLIAVVFAKNYQEGISAIEAGADDFILHCDLSSQKIADTISLCFIKRLFKKNLSKAKNLVDSAH